jgi:hypothetical protein
VCIELDGDFNTEGTEDTVKTRKRGEKEEIRRFTAEGSGDAEDAEKKKQIPRFARNDSNLFWSNGILMMTTIGA